ncbi:MAG: LEA type 2 family protein [Chitinophagaceae bacterium]
MKRMVIWGLVALATSLLFLQSCSKPAAPEYAGIDNFKVNSIGADQSVISADLKYYNPNHFALKLKDGETSVFVNNRFIGKSTLDTFTVIPARDSFLIPVSMKVDMKQVYANALDILLNREVTIKLDGFAKLGKGGVYFNVPIQYEGKQKIDINF